jgi:uncharacterized protein YecE (DUF72 family)
MTESRLLVGCCGWAEAQARYVKDFQTIELQSTFYQMPSADVAKRWKALAPPEFRFCLKAWQLITHTPASPTYRRLKSKLSDEEADLYGSFRPTEQVWLAWERTREIADILDAEVIVFQCPKSFLPSRENVRNFSTFFREVERRGRIFAWEPRGENWSPEVVRELCAESDLVHCVDPFQSEPAYGRELYWRLHGRTGYRYRYTEQDLAELEETLTRFDAVQRRSYVMFNNIYSKQDALRFLERR